MDIHNNFIYTGNILFKYRSYIPLMLLPLMIYSIKNIDNVYIDYNIAILTGCFLISIIGFILRISVVGTTPNKTSGRNTKKQVASVLNKTGIYSILRHPLYLANYFILSGLVLYSCQIIYFIIFTLLFILYYERIIFVEENYLSNKFNSEFFEWSKATSTIIPKLNNYKANIHKISLKKILFREYTGFCALIAIYCILVETYSYFHYLAFSSNFMIKLIFISNGIIYLVLRSIKKNIYG
tara:strand:- start:507 stop:1223 length:717 start_codon:yes stop_codon:yes gene_type:complete